MFIKKSSAAVLGALRSTSGDVPVVASVSVNKSVAVVRRDELCVSVAVWLTEVAGEVVAGEVVVVETGCDETGCSGAR